ncbi:hypothetical protein EDB83DRAFT_1223532 [Lactarius deliciosus]|nr:hypothetical protein EDB83DRAFT_1223532 [Lactarius deliciosus]
MNVRSDGRRKREEGKYFDHMNERRSEGHHHQGITASVACRSGAITTSRVEDCQARLRRHSITNHREKHDDRAASWWSPGQRGVAPRVCLGFAKQARRWTGRSQSCTCCRARQRPLAVLCDGLLCHSIKLPRLDSDPRHTYAHMHTHMRKTRTELEPSEPRTQPRSAHCHSATLDPHAQRNMAMRERSKGPERMGSSHICDWRSMFSVVPIQDMVDGRQGRDKYVNLD